METVIIIKKKKYPKFNNTPEYNKEYYAKHKREILDVLNAKCICPHCGRQTSKQRMRQHKETVLCLKNRKPPELLI